MINENHAIKSWKGLAILNILSFILVITMNTLAVVLPLNGKTTGQLSDEYPNLFTPAGLTFSIWSIIYLFLLGFVIYQAVVLLKVYHPAHQKILRISTPFIINCIANAGWIVAWHHEQVLLSVAIMFVILGSLIIIHNRLHLALPAKPIAEKLWLDLPFSFYLGWISIATIANITALLIHYNWGGGNLSPSSWTIIVISLGTLLNMYMVFIRNNIAFALVGIWAFTGIIFKRQLVEQESNNHIIFCAELCISLIVVSIILQLFKYWKSTAGKK
jgi:hypothetical protein